MTYTKPEIEVLGEAAKLIELVGLPKRLSRLDIPFWAPSPAYDLDD